MNRVVIFGKNGQIASSLQKTEPNFFQTTYFGHDEAPFDQKEKILNILQDLKPQIVINASAYTSVDLAETDKLSCYRINCETPAFIAKWSHTNAARFVQYSTDYVFDGTKREPYLEDDETHPINIYGKSKRDMENIILKESPNAYIFRTSWVYNENGKNFLNTMIRLKDKDTLSIVTDQIGVPSYAFDVASATWNILTHSRMQEYAGIYHIANEGVTTWFDFAKEIFGYLDQKPELKAVLTADFKTVAARPLYSKLSTDKLFKDFGVRLPFWKDSLKVCMKNKLQ